MSCMCMLWGGVHYLEILFILLQELHYFLNKVRNENASKFLSSTGKIE